MHVTGQFCIELFYFVKELIRMKFSLICSISRGARTLDYILVSSDVHQPYLKGKILYDSPLGNSDHCVISAVPLTCFSPDNVKTSHIVMDYRRSNLERLLQYVNQIDWIGLVTSSRDVNDQWKVLHESLLAAIHSCIPQRTVIISKTDKEWMTPLTKALINDRWQAFRERKWKLYEHLKEKVKHEIIRAKTIWADKLKSSPHGLWRLVKSSSRGNADSLSNLIATHGSVERILEEIADKLSTSFQAVSSDSEEVEDDGWQLHISPLDVKYQLNRLKCGKSPGHDGIPMQLYKLLSEHLAEPLAIIMNESLRQRVYPSGWKEGIIIPIPKTKPPELDKLRFITLLPAPSKIMEKILLNKLWTFFSFSYGPEQHGFRPGLSTTTALLQLSDDLTQAYDDTSNSGIAILSFDLSRAFDCVEHTLISRILLSCDFPSGFVLWLDSYLCGRMSRARVGGIFSKVVQMSRGVPQGSVLGPPIFCAYVGRIRALQSGVSTMKYADDISLVIPLKRGSMNAMKQQIEDEVENIAAQTASLHLQLNRSKSKAMIIWRSKSHENMSLTIPMTESMKVLGVILNVKLDWSMHVKNICKVANQRFHLLRKLKNLVSRRELHDVYVAIIRSLVEYACPIFIGIKDKYSKELQKINKRAHKIINGANNENQKVCTCMKTVLTERRHEISKKLFLNIESNPDHILHNRIPKHLTYTQHYQTTYCRTNRRQRSFFVHVAALLNDYV